MSILAKNYSINLMIRHNFQYQYLLYICLKFHFLKEKCPFSNIHHTNSLVDQEGSNVVFILDKGVSKDYKYLNFFVKTCSHSQIFPTPKYVNENYRGTTYCVTEMTAIYIFACLQLQHITQGTIYSSLMLLKL